MSTKFLIALCAILSMGMSCTTETREESESGLGYNLSEPDAVMQLSDSLREISDISMADDSTVISVQDELGILFFLSARNGAIVRKQAFSSDGDYEGVAVVGESVFVLRSDGVLFLISDGQDSTVQMATGIPASNNEGFCYDAAGNRLLIGPASRPMKRPILHASKGVYAYDLRSQKLLEEPLWKFDLDEIHNFASAHSIPLPEYKAKKRKKTYTEIRFHISGIAIQPFTGDLWLISAQDEMLFVFDKEGNIREMHTLPRETFHKPEGIAFLPSGTLLISNEGPKGGKATLVRFDYLDKKP